MKLAEMKRAKPQFLKLFFKIEQRGDETNQIEIFPNPTPKWFLANSLRFAKILRSVKSSRNINYPKALCWFFNEKLHVLLARSLHEKAYEKWI